MANFLSSLPKAESAKQDEGPKQPTIPCTVASEGSKVTITYDLSQIDGTPETGHIRLTKKAKAPYVTLDVPDSALVNIDGTPVALSFQGMRLNAYLKIASAASK